jgi:hypothetical protein
VLPLAEKAVETGDVEPVHEVLAAELHQQPHGETHAG